MPDKKISPLVIKNAIFAEDVRAEANGKYSILGIYSGDILVQEVAGFIKSAIYLEIISKRMGRIELKVEAHYNKKIIFSAEGLLDVHNDHDPAIFQVPSFAIAIDGGGIITVDVITDGIRKRALTKIVKQADLKAVARARESSLKSLARTPPRKSRRSRDS